MAQMNKISDQQMDELGEILSAFSLREEVPRKQIGHNVPHPVVQPSTSESKSLDASSKIKSLAASSLRKDVPGPPNDQMTPKSTVPPQTSRVILRPKSRKLLLKERAAVAQKNSGFDSHAGPNTTLQPKTGLGAHDNGKMVPKDDEVLRKVVNATRQVTSSTTPCADSGVEPRLADLAPIFAQLYLKLEKSTREVAGIPQKYVFKIADLKSNITDYAKFCDEANKLLIDPDDVSNPAPEIRAQKTQKVAQVSRDGSLRCWWSAKRTFVSAASAKVARLNARRALIKGIRKKISLQPRDDNPMIIEMRKKADAAAQAGAFSSPYRVGFANTLEPAVLKQLSILYTTKKPGKLPKRKFQLPHHVAGSSIVGEAEFALLERKVCGGHRSKRLCNKHGRPSRIPSKAMIFNRLVWSDARFSWFSEFLSSTRYGINFMKSIPRALTKFTCFGRLPRELQNLVWEHALPERRIVRLRRKPNETLLKPGVPLLDAVTRYGFLSQVVKWFDEQGEPSQGPDFRTKEEFLQARLQYLSEAETRLLKNHSAVKPDPRIFKNLAINEKYNMDEYFGELSPGDWQLYQLAWNHAKRAEVGYANGYNPRERVAPFDAVSALLQTCKVSREQVLLRYEASFENLDGSKQYCNYQSDAILLDWPGFWKLETQMRTGVVLETKSRLMKKQAHLSQTWLQHASKILHLVIKSDILPCLEDESFKKMAKAFPNVRRLTIEATKEFNPDLPKLWDTDTQNCNMQRWIGDTWFQHLPFRDEVGTQTHYDEIKQKLDEFLSMTPHWQPFCEIRQFASRRRDVVREMNKSTGECVNWAENFGFKEIGFRAMGQEWRDED